MPEVIPAWFRDCRNSTTSLNDSQSCVADLGERIHSRGTGPRARRRLIKTPVSIEAFCLIILLTINIFHSRSRGCDSNIT